MLPDQKHAVDGKFVPAERQRVCHRPKDGHVIFPGPLPAHIALRHVLRKHGDDFRSGIRRPVVLVVAFEVLTNNHIGVGPRPVLGDDCCNLFRRRRILAQGESARSGGREECSSLHEGVFSEVSSGRLCIH